MAEIGTEPEVLDIELRKDWPGFGLNVRLAAGDEMVVLFGPSGSGKSLTLQCIAGLLRPEGGHIVINGRTIFDGEERVWLPPQRRRVGYVPQGYSLFPHLNVAENIAFGLPERGAPDGLRRAREMISLMRLSELEQRHPHQLSGGQQQRVALARALIVKPDVLLLDEPFAALDSPMRSKLRRELLDVCSSFGGTALFVTHDPVEAYMLGEKIAVLEGGEVLQVGTREEVMQRPKTRAVARFTQAKNLFAGRVLEWLPHEVRVEVVMGDTSFVVRTPPYGVAEGEEVELCIRPEDVMLLRPDRPIGAALRENQLRGSIVAELAQGTTYALFFKIGESAAGSLRDYDLEIHIPKHAYERLLLHSKKEWTVSLKKSAIHVIGKERLGAQFMEEGD